MDDIITTGEVTASPFVIRDLKSTDVWNFTRVLAKLRIKEFTKTIDPKLLKKANFKAPEMLGPEGELVPLPRDRWTEAQIQAELDAELANDELLWAILGVIMENIGNCEQDVNRLLADGIGKDVAFIRNMDAGEYMELLAQYISRDGFRDFFTQAWRLLSRISPSRKSFGAAMETLTDL